MLVVIAPMAVCYPAIKTDLAIATPLQFTGERTLLGGLLLLFVLVLRQQPLWPQARLARWILPLGVMATTFIFGAMFASPAETGAGVASVLGNTQPLIISVLAALFLGEQIKLGEALRYPLESVKRPTRHEGARRDLAALRLVPATAFRGTVRGFLRIRSTGSNRPEQPRRAQRPCPPCSRHETDWRSVARMCSTVFRSRPNYDPGEASRTATDWHERCQWASLAEGEDMTRCRGSRVKPSDEVLMERYAGGDDDAFDEISCRYESMAHAFFVRATGCPGRARDLYLRSSSFASTGLELSSIPRGPSSRGSSRSRTISSSTIGGSHSALARSRSKSAPWRNRGASRTAWRSGAIGLHPR